MPRPPKAPDFHWLDADNGAPDPAALIAQPTTPTEQVFVRSHGTPEPHPARLTIAGCVAQPITLTLADLQARPAVTLPAALACAGNRREELAAHQPIAPAELPWGTSAIASGVWTGVRLADLLAEAGITPDAAHAAFSGADGFGGSIPIAKARQPEVLLAYAYDDQPLTAAHGAPLRVIVPGYIGARSVKWVTAITLQPEPSDNYYQQVAYRLYPSHFTDDAQIAADREAGVMLGELPINAAIVQPIPNASVPAGAVTVRGWALSGDAAIVRVAVQVDDGPWHDAALSADHGAWAWRLWTVTADLSPGTHTIRACAWDSAGRSQPADPAAVWNYKGYLNHAQPVIALTAT